MNLNEWTHPKTGQTRHYLDTNDVETIALQVARDADEKLSNADLYRIRAAKFWLDTEGELHIDRLDDRGKIWRITSGLRTALEAATTPAADVEQPADARLMTGHEMTRIATASKPDTSADVPATASLIVVDDVEQARADQEARDMQRVRSEYADVLANDEFRQWQAAFRATRGDDRPFSKLKARPVEFIARRWSTMQREKKPTVPTPDPRFTGLTFRQIRAGFINCPVLGGLTRANEPCENCCSIHD